MRAQSLGFTGHWAFVVEIPSGLESALVAGLGFRVPLKFYIGTLIIGIGFRGPLYFRVPVKSQPHSPIRVQGPQSLEEGCGEFYTAFTSRKAQVKVIYAGF